MPMPMIVSTLTHAPAAVAEMALQAIGVATRHALVAPLTPLPVRGSPRLVGRVPDYPGTLLGWRAWLLGEDDRGPVLLSPEGGRWLEGWAMRTDCPHEGVRGRSGPGEACACGIRALRDTPAARRLMVCLAAEQDLLVTGRVHLWGEVVEHTRGMRAEAAYPHDLVAPDAELAAALAERYGVPVADATGLAPYVPLLG